MSEQKKHKLIALYDLIMKNEELYKSWHDSYKKFYNRTIEITEKNSPYSQNTEDFNMFLQQLLYEKSNGVASKGLSILSEADFNKLKSNSSFITNALIPFLINPKNTQLYQYLKTEWKKVIGKNNPVIINRIAASATLDVSSTIDQYAFSEVLQYLSDKQIIDLHDYQGNWLENNIKLMNFIHETFHEKLETDTISNKIYLSIFVWLIYMNRYESFKLKKQLIKYGAPGTGKTFTAKKDASLSFDSWKISLPIQYDDDMLLELVQFHPSFSYEDFIEGVRPVLGDNKQSQLQLVNGVFKDFCKKAGQWEIDIFNVFPDISGNSISTLTLGDLDCLRDTFTDTDYSHWEYIFALKDKDPKNNQLKLIDILPPCFFIIDEINRAELSSVFGELMYCLEYRGTEGKIKSQYAGLNTKETCLIYDKKTQSSYFFIPHNVYIIGTMNTIDRSIESFDFALRRRFIWQELTPDIELLETFLPEQLSPLAKNLSNLNDAICKEPLLGSDYLIGHSYLMNLSMFKDHDIKQVREMIWADSIKPLLQEYYRGISESSQQLAKLKKAFLES